MTLYDRIYELCKENGIGLTTLEANLGFGNGSICGLKKPGTSPTAARLQKIAAYFGVTMDYLMTGSDSGEGTVSNAYRIDKQSIPALGSIACGELKPAAEESESCVLAGTEIKADFCLIASGDSMINARINDGDIVFICKQPIVDNGDIAAVIVGAETEAKLKRFFYYRDKALLILRSENPAYEDLIFQDEEISNVKVIGKAIAFQSNII